MNILVLSCGSSWLKFQLIATDSERIADNTDQRLAHGEIERIGGAAIITFAAEGKLSQRSAAPIRDIKAAVEWRMLPADFPNWKTVRHYFTVWRENGLWKAIYEPLRAAERGEKGRESQPTAGCLDSQSVKTGRYCVEEKSYNNREKSSRQKKTFTWGNRAAVRGTRRANEGDAALPHGVSAHA